MRKLKLFFACLLMAVLSIGQVWGADQSVKSTFSTSSTISENKVTENGVTWTLDVTTATGSPTITTGTANQIQGLKFGSSGSNYYSPIKFSTDYFKDYNVKSVTIYEKNNGKKIGTLTVKQGSTTIGTASHSAKTSDWATLTASGTKGAGGTLEVTYEVEQASYFNYIEVVYEEGGTTCTSEITITKADDPVNGTFELSDEGAVCIDGGNATITVTASPDTHYHLASVTTTGSVGTIGSITGNTCEITDIDADTEIGVTFAEDTKYVVTWNVNGNEDTKTNVYEGEKPVFPATPAACDATSTTFIGWATAPWTGKLADLSEKTVYTSASAMPDVDAAVTYYAVFAKVSGTPSVTHTLTISGKTAASGYASRSETDDKDATWSGVYNYGDETHIGLNKKSDNHYLGSPLFDANVISVKATIKNGSSSTRSAYLRSENETAQPSSGDLGSVSVPANDEKELTFTLGETAFKQFYVYVSDPLQFHEFIVTLEGSATYSDYMTTCCTQYNVNIANNIENGSVSADPTAACEGAMVTLTFEPSLNYHLSGWTLNGAAQDVNANTFSMPAGAATVSATFEQDACEPLATPDVTVSGKAYPYDAVKLAWTAIDNADAYKVYIYDAEDNELEHNDAFAGVEYTIGQTLSASTTYKYSVQAVSSTPATYCPSVAATGSFVTEALPTAHLTLIDLEGEHVSSGDYAILTPFNLPTTAASCSKVFYGWTATNGYSSENEAPEYVKGAEFTFANTTGVTLYAVYADETPGEATIKTDELDYEFTGLTGTSYKEWSGKTGTSGAVYAGQSCALGSNPSSTYIQLRINNSNSGVVTTTTGAGKVTKVTVTWNAAQGNDGIKLDVYGKNTAYSQATDLYGDNAGTLLGSIVKGTSTELVISGSYTYLGLRSNSGTVYLDEIDVQWTAQAASTFSNYSTTCVAAPTAEPASASIAVAAAGGEGTLGVSYENVNLAGVTVALYNNEACTEAFDGGWLTATIEGNDKHIAYTIAENTAYAARTAYIKLTAPETSGAANPAVVVIPVEQAKKPAVFASLEDLVAAELASGTEVTVSFANEVITDDQYISQGTKRAGLMLTTKAANNKAIEIFYNKGTTVVPAEWLIGGKLAANAKTFTWTLFNDQWELVPLGNDWTWDNGDLTYTAPKAVSSVVITGAPTKTVYTIGETFEPAGLTVTVNYSDETSEVNPAVGVTFTTDPANGKMALEQTSIKVKATYNTVTSEEWFNVEGLTVNDLETKTVAEFIAAEGGRCYLIGTVSNITNTTYGNFNLTDASGTIYVYGCLDTEGASKNFASLDVVEDDYIKVIADVYEYYNNETHEAKNVQFVEELEKPDVPVTSVSVANATVKINKTVQLTANVLPINASNKNVTWSVKAGSEAIAEVNETTGVVTGLSEGEAVIIATSVADNTKFGECTVTVTGGINFAAGDFVLVENAAELTEGTYVIVADAGTTYNVAMKYLEGTDKIHKSTAAVKEGKFLHYDSEFGVYQIKNYVVSEEVVGLSFLNEDAENYLALPSASNELRVSETQDANSAWTVSISDGVATIANKALTARKIRYNSGSPRFACYESGQRDIALYKYVTPAVYRVYYDDNVAEEEIEVPAYQSVNGENKVTITAVEPVRDGYLFDGWKDGDANVYEAGVEYTLSSDITLYAQWTTATVSTLSYNPNGGTLIGGETAIAPADVAEGTNLTIEANVYEKGDNFVFAGWQLGDDVYQPGDPFVMPATDVEFVAKWDAVEVSDYALVTDLAQLQAGDKIIIVAADYNVAAGSQAATYRNPVTIGKTASKNNLILNELAMPTEFVLGIADGKFSFNDGAGYMYENGEKSVKVQDDPYYWTISIDGDAIATITGTNPLLYNSNNNQERFTTYTSEQKVLQLYRKPGDAPSYTTVRENLNIGEYYTICLENVVSAVQGGSIWRVLSKAANDKDIILEEVTGNLDAGRPYIFRAAASTLEVAYTGDAVGAPVNDEDNNGLVGSFTEEPLAQNSNHYIIYNNALYFVNSDNVYVGANRAYLDMTGVPAYNNEPQQGAPRRRVTMTVYNEQTTTGIDELNASDTPVKMIIDGQLFIIRGEKMFDATGRLVK